MPADAGGEKNGAPEDSTYEFEATLVPEDERFADDDDDETYRKTGYKGIELADARKALAGDTAKLAQFDEGLKALQAN